MKDITQHLSENKHNFLSQADVGQQQWIVPETNHNWLSVVWQLNFVGWPLFNSCRYTNEAKNWRSRKHKL